MSFIKQITAWAEPRSLAAPAGLAERRHNARAARSLLQTLCFKYLGASKMVHSSCMDSRGEEFRSTVMGYSTDAINIPSAVSGKWEDTMVQAV